MKAKKVYLLTDEQMQEITDKICQLSREAEETSVVRKASEVNNMLAQLPSIEGSDTLDVAIEKVADLMYEGGE
jgi:hypothetical protein